MEKWIGMGIMLVSLVSYLVACKVKDKTSFSISNSFYKWGSWRGIWFIMSLWGVSIGAWVVAKSFGWEGVSQLRMWGQSLIVVAGFFLWLVATFADYLASKFQLWMHLIPSYASIGLGLIGVGLIGWDKYDLVVGLLPIFGFGAASIAAFFALRNNVIWWVEIFGFVFVLLGLLYS